MLRLQLALTHHFCSNVFFPSLGIMWGYISLQSSGIPVDLLRLYVQLFGYILFMKPRIFQDQFLYMYRYHSHDFLKFYTTFNNVLMLGGFTFGHGG